METIADPAAASDEAETRRAAIDPVAPRPVRRACRTGLVLTVRHWKLGGGLWIVSLAAGAVFAWASGDWLSNALGDSLATRNASRDLDANIFIDLYYHHAESLRMLLVVAAVIAAGYLVVSFWLHAALILVVQARRDLRLAAAFRDSLALAPLMARLFALAVVVLGVFSVVVIAATWRSIRATAAQPTEMISYQLGAAGAVIWVLGYVALVAVHDHARLRACATNGSAFESYWWAVRFVLAGGERAYGLALVLHLTAAVLWCVYQGATLRVPVSGNLVVGALFVWGELFLLLRMWLRIWFFAAQNDLQSPL